MKISDCTTPTLALFDVDGTLIMTGDVRHRHAFATGVREYFGLEWPPRHRNLDYAGMVDAQILAEVLRANGGLRDEHLALFPPALARMGEAYQRSRVGPPVTVLPGVRPLLRALRRGGARLALTTGNVQAVAWAKMRRARLSAYFSTGAFGDDCQTRDELVPIALQRAEAAFGVTFARERVVVIGDTLRDISCARAAGVRVIGVATGKYDTATLLAAGADHAVPDLSDTQRLVRLILNGRAEGATADVGAGRGEDKL